jgi:hypothetical protein
MKQNENEFTVRLQQLVSDAHTAHHHDELSDEGVVLLMNYLQKAIAHLALVPMSGYSIDRDKEFSRLNRLLHDTVSGYLQDRAKEELSKN